MTVIQRGRTGEEMLRRIEVGGLDTVVLAMTDMQGRLQGKRCDAQFFTSHVVPHNAEGCNYLLAVDIDMHTVDGFALTSWDKGYGDFVMRPDLTTLRTTPWLPGSAICLADVEYEDGTPVAPSPRQVLRRQLARLAERGWTALAGTELEFMV